MSTALPLDGRLQELLADRTVVGLDEVAETELAALMAAHPEVEADHFELAAAAIHLNSPAPQEEMPGEIEARIRAAARAHFGVAAEPPAAAPAVEASAPAPVLPFEPPAAAEPATPAPSASGRFGWYVAAACLAAAVAGWWPGRTAVPPGPVVAPPPVAEERPLTGPRLAAQDGSLDIAWTATEDPSAAQASGRVVWNNQLQKGFMLFAGLEANDPATSQYQLWIFDKNQDERYPVDGGVFNVGPNGETWVAIDPKLEIEEPTLFAITVEKPGGVVVSSRERIVLVASTA